MNVLIIEDDLEQAAQLMRALEHAGHQSSHAEDGERGEQMLHSQEFDVAIVDRMLPKRDGLTLIANLRASGNATPALILSALGQVDDRVTGLRAGGDDYLAKPYAFEELLARVEILARRSESTGALTSVSVADLTLDRITHSAERSGHKITLQPREYRLLDYLMLNQGRLVTRTMLLQNVWDLNFDPQTNVIDVHISRLRTKIDKDFEQPLLHTVRGKGYKLMASSPSDS